EKEVKHEANHGAAEDTDILEHFAHAQPFGRCFGLWKFLFNEHQPVDQGGKEVERKLGLPAPTELVTQGPADHPAETHPERPTGVQDIEIMVSVLRKEGGHQRV